MTKFEQLIVIIVASAVLYFLIKSEAAAGQAVTALPSALPPDVYIPPFLNGVQQDYQIVINGPSLTN